MDVTPIRIALAADRAFFRHLPTAIGAITATTPGPIVFGVAVQGVPERARARLRAMVDAPVDFFDVEGAAIAGLGFKASLSAMTYARLLMADLTGWDRFLYLDVDAVAMRDLAELWGTALEGRPAAGVFHGGRLNAGVLLIDGALWRAEGLTERMLRHGRDHAPKEADQAVIEAVIGARMLRLDPCWNRTVDPLWGGPAQARPDYLEGAGIVHYLTGFKPWNLGRLLMPARLSAPWDRRHVAPAGLPRDLAAEARLLAWQLRILALRAVGAK